MDANRFDFHIYQKLPQLVLGFHGCDRAVAEKVLNSPTEHLHPSRKEYDWLGEGVYFWLNDPLRAYEWACQTKKKKSSSIKEPYVIGAVIDLGCCLNLCERDSILLLQKSYEDLKAASLSSGMDINKQYVNGYPDSGGFNLYRPLDCAIIQYVHAMVEAKGLYFDTVYGYFQEGEDAFPGAGIKAKSHIQISVQNTDCIKGYFLPRELKK